MHGHMTKLGNSSKFNFTTTNNTNNNYHNNSSNNSHNHNIGRVRMGRGSRCVLSLGMLLFFFFFFTVLTTIITSS